MLDLKGTSFLDDPNGSENKSVSKFNDICTKTKGTELLLNWSQIHCPISGLVSLVPFKLRGFFRRYDIDKNEIGSGGYGKVWR